MKAEWVKSACILSRTPADFYSGCRKILRARTVMFPVFEDPDDRLELADAGYTRAKMAYLRRNYIHEESIVAAVQLWDRRRKQAKYGSVGFSTYGHFIKNDPEKKSKRASVMGPCIQAVTLTWLSKSEVAVDVFYRTTEWLKKFPADLVFLRDELMPRFDLEGMTISEVSCHFANITIHPMYFVTIIPHLDDPLSALRRIKKSDEYFYNWLVKWSARYLCGEYARGIAKFSQALRVQKDALERIEPDVLEVLRKHLRDNHPGIRGGPDIIEEDD